MFMFALVPLNVSVWLRFFSGHADEVLDVCFSLSGDKICTASADSTARVYNSLTLQCMSTLIGHEGEISKVLYRMRTHAKRGEGAGEREREKAVEHRMNSFAPAW